ncbi:MAG: site-specific integrase, partial [Pirellulaceae bacterium]
MIDVSGRGEVKMAPDQLPTIIPPGNLTTTTDTYVVPVLIARAGDQAAWRYVEFFTANIRNPNTRRAYARACTHFLAWCEQGQLALTTIRSVHVATWVEQLQEKHSAPSVKQQLAAVRMLFDWLITGQVVPTNPAAAV